jgi:hypothetical protein
MDTQRMVKVVEDAKGRKLLVEISRDAEVVGITKQGGDDEDLFEAVSVSDKVVEFTSSLSTLISDTTAAILDGIEKIAQPSKIQVEFGVDLGAEGGVWFIAKGSINSTIKVSIEWEKLKAS